MSGGQNKNVFPSPIYREGKTQMFFAARYIGKAKLKCFLRPDISGRQNSNVFCRKTKLKCFSRLDISGRQNSNVFCSPIYREGKTQKFFAARYIWKTKLKCFFQLDISGWQNFF